MPISEAIILAFLAALAWPRARPSGVGERYEPLERTLGGRRPPRSRDIEGLRSRRRRRLRLLDREAVPRRPLPAALRRILWASWSSLSPPMASTKRGSASRPPEARETASEGSSSFLPPSLLASCARALAASSSSSIWKAAPSFAFLLASRSCRAFFSASARLLSSSCFRMRSSHWRSNSSFSAGVMLLVSGFPESLDRPRPSFGEEGRFGAALGLGDLFFFLAFTGSRDSSDASSFPSPLPPGWKTSANLHLDSVSRCLSEKRSMFSATTCSIFLPYLSATPEANLGWVMMLKTSCTFALPDGIAFNALSSHSVFPDPGSFRVTRKSQDTGASSVTGAPFWGRC
mmetsp:Transcript_22455/g.50606  ORF Transcript_22455/g.50606 Transcript_22455/m.50606 type:complete len:345 (-) Transcript_22455:170-1204(-)